VVHLDFALFDFGHRAFPDTNKSTTTDGNNRFHPDLQNLKCLYYLQIISRAPKSIRIIVFDQGCMDFNYFEVSEYVEDYS
jgi:hypothetical protein